MLKLRIEREGVVGLYLNRIGCIRRHHTEALFSRAQNQRSPDPMASSLQTKYSV